MVNLLLDIIKLSKMSIFKILKFDNNEIIDNCDNNKSNKKLFKFKKTLALKYIFTFLKLAFIYI